MLEAASSLDEEGWPGSTGEQRQNCFPTLPLSSWLEQGLGGGRGPHWGQRNKKADIRSTVSRFFTGRGWRGIRGGGVTGGFWWGGGRQICPASTHVCLIRLGPFLWEKSEEAVEKKRRKVTMHSEMGAAQFGPTVTPVSNLQYESDEKSRDEEGSEGGVDRRRRRCRRWGRGRGG